MACHLQIPKAIRELLEQGAHVLVNVSGGKDSDAMLKLLWDAYTLHGWRGDFRVVTCDLQRNEWDFSLPHIQKFVSETTGKQVEVIRREQGDLVDQWWTRYRTLQQEGRADRVPPWSSASARFCTKAQKEAQVNKFIVKQYPQEAVILSCIGIRADESPARKHKQVVQVYTQSPSAPTKNRHVYRWLPIHEFSLSDVWSTLGWTLERLEALRSEVKANIQPGDREGLYALLKNWNYHANPVYALGNDRCSCRLCVLANQNDLLNGILWNPDHYRDLVELELISGFSFQQGRWLAEMQPDLLSDEQRQRWTQLRQTVPQASIKTITKHTSPVQLALPW